MNEDELRKNYGRAQKRIWKASEEVFVIFFDKLIDIETNQSIKI